MDDGSPTGARPWMTVLSWNVHGLPFHNAPLRLTRIAAWVREHQPDLVLLQEVWSSGHLRLLAQAVAGDYEAVSVGGRLGSKPRGGLAVLLRRESAWQPIRVDFERYQRTAPWYKLNEGDGLAGKGILAVEVRRDDERLLVIDTHLQAGYGARRYPEVRRAQLEQLTAFVERAGRDAPLLIGGDLNTEPDEDLYRDHIAPLGSDLTEVERRHAGGTCFDARGKRTEWIDYVLLRGVPARASLTRIESDAPDDRYSDHDGLLVRIDR